MIAWFPFISSAVLDPLFPSFCFAILARKSKNTKPFLFTVSAINCTTATHFKFNNKTNNKTRATNSKEKLKKQQIIMKIKKRIPYTRL